jgi:hypothetical protein
MTFKTVVHALIPRSRLQTAVVTAVLAGSLTAGVSYASIPDNSGVIHGCYNNNSGDLKVINTATSPTCPKHTTSLNWNQTGSPGAPSYATTATIPIDNPSTGPGTGSATLTLPTGTYVILNNSQDSACTVSATGGSVSDYFSYASQGTGFAHITSPTGQVEWSCDNYTSAPSIFLGQATAVTTQ